MEKSLPPILFIYFGIVTHYPLIGLGSWQDHRAGWFDLKAELFWLWAVALRLGRGRPPGFQEAAACRPWKLLRWSLWCWAERPNRSLIQGRKGNTHGPNRKLPLNLDSNIIDLVSARLLPVRERWATSRSNSCARNTVFHLRSSQPSIVPNSAIVSFCRAQKCLVIADASPYFWDFVCSAYLPLNRHVRLLVL